MRHFSLEELAHYDGRDGAPAYVACDGIVYDVTKSFLWQQGRHQALHTAGTDLTSSLAQAPHGIDVLHEFPAIGVLA